MQVKMLDIQCDFVDMEFNIVLKLVFIVQIYLHSNRLHALIQ